VGRITPAKGAPKAVAAPAGPGGDDDFQIERF
jgi:hypothetical protein